MRVDRLRIPKISIDIGLQSWYNVLGVFHFGWNYCSVGLLGDHSRGCRVVPNSFETHPNVFSRRENDRKHVDRRR